MIEAASPVRATRASKQRSCAGLLGGQASCQDGRSRASWENISGVPPPDPAVDEPASGEAAGLMGAADTSGPPSRTGGGPDRAGQDPFFRRPRSLQLIHLLSEPSAAGLRWRPLAGNLVSAADPHAVPSGADSGRARCLLGQYCVLGRAKRRDKMKVVRRIRSVAGGAAVSAIRS